MHSQALLPTLLLVYDQGGIEREFYDPTDGKYIVSFTFPIRFTNSPFYIRLQSIQRAASYRTTWGTVIANTITSLGFKAYHSEFHGDTQSAKISYIAIGI